MFCSKFMKNLKLGFIISLVLILTGCFNKSTDIKVNRDQARVAYDDAAAKYAHELKLISKLKVLNSASNSDTESNRQLRDKLSQDLQHEILLKHEEYNRDIERQWIKFNNNKYENYPYMHYREHLDQQIQDLEKIGTAVYWKHEGLGRSIQDLISDLNDLRRYVILHKEYNLERRLLEKKAMLKEAQE